MPHWLNLSTTSKLAIVPRPRGGDWLDDEIRNLRRDGIDVLVSLLTPEEEKELGLNGEAAACEEGSIEFRNFPIPDRQFPASSQTFRAFVEELRALRLQGKNIGAHCRAGIGRSSLLLASLLVTEGYSPDDAFDLISEARGLRVPDTPEQIEWVKNFNSSF
jgi:protein-tyrosine phosphatase